VQRSVLGKFGAAIAVVYIAWAFGYLFYNVFSTLRDAFFALGAGWMYFAVNAVFVFSTCVITTVFTAQAQIFEAKDNELLLSMPIRPSAILTSRILTLLVTEYVFEALISIPALLVWISGGYFTAVGAAFFAAGFVLLPLLALSVSCLLAWLLTILTSGMRRKNIANLVVSVAFLGGYFLITANAQRYAAGLIENGSAIAESLKKALPPIYFYGNAIASGDALHMLLFTLCAIVPFALIIALLSANFIKTVTTKRGIRKREYREQTAKQRSTLAALVRRELARYFGNSMLILNMSLGGMFAVAGGVALVIKRAAAIALLASILPALRLSVSMASGGSPALGGLYALMSSPATLAGLALMFCSSMNCASASLISLEGRMLWILRSAPVRARDALLAKILLHMLVSALPILVASALAVFALFGGDIAAATLVFILPFVFTLLIAFGGLAINLLLPKFEWLNELQAVKQGMPIILMMLGSIALLTGAVLLYILLLHRYMDALQYGWALAGAFAVLSALLYRWTVTRGARRFDAFPA
jgi:ABC-2 type transport system permease protein